MSRNIFSKIFSFYSLKLFFVVMLCVIFGFGGIKNIKARILIEPLNIDQSKLDTTFPENNWPNHHFLDLLYNSNFNSTTKWDITFNNTDTQHGTTYLGAKNTAAVESYLNSLSSTKISETNNLIETIRKVYIMRPDLVLCTPAMNPGGIGYSCDSSGGTIYTNDRKTNLLNHNIVVGTTSKLVAANAAEQSNIVKILNSTSSKNFSLVLDTVKSLYPNIYLKYFNSAAVLTASQFDLHGDFEDTLASNLVYFMMNYYMKSLQDHMIDDNTPEDIVIKKRIQEIINISKVNSPSLATGFTLDANGVSTPIWGDADVKDQSWNASKFFPAITWVSTATTTPPTPPAPPSPDPVKPSCTAGGFLEALNNSSCHVVAYLVNNVISGIAQLFGVILSWIGALFNWIFDFSIMNFHSWIENSKAVDIYKTIILAFIASLMLPLVFYLVIRMLIDNDSRNIEKLLPKILITALFVYFSFGIAGWLVDQSNIVTIYIYRAIHGGDTSQNLGDVIQCTLGIQAGCNKNAVDILNETGGVSMWEWSSVSYTFGQLLINLVGLYIVFQAMILIFARSIVFLLCLIFSPIMLLPDGLPGKIGEIITKYRGTVMTYFTNNLLLAPIFMFLMMLAIRIGKISGDLIPDTSSLDAQTAGHPGFLGGMIKTIIVIVVMQLAITVAKNLSGEVGSTISGAISNFAGGVASGATNAFNRIRGARQTNTGGGANNGTNPWQTNNTQARRPIPLQSTQSSVITPTGQSVQNQALGNNFAAASSKINKENQSIINSLPDTKRRSLGGYQAISNQRQKSAANRNSVQQKATQNNRSVATQTQVNNARIERKKNQANAKMGGGNNPSSPKAPQKLELARVNNSVSTQNPNTGVTNANQNSVTETTNPGVSPVSPNSSRNNQARELLKDKDVRQAVKEGGFGKAFVGGSPKKQQAMAGTLKAITQERMVKRDKSSSKASDQLADTNQKPKALIGNNKPDKV